MSRAAPNAHPLLEPLEEAIRVNLIPTLTGRPPPNNLERKLFGLPVRLGVVVSPLSLCSEYEASVSLTFFLTSLTLDQSSQYSFETLLRQEEARSSIRQMREFHFKTKVDSLTLELPDDHQYAIILAQEKGASSWLTSLPISEHGHALHKGGFCDALALR